MVAQQPDRDGGQFQDQRVPGGPGAGGAGSGGQDGPDVGAPPAERDRPVQRGGECLVAVGGAQGGQLGQFRSQPGVPRRGGAGDERLGDRAQRAELLLRRGFRPYRPPRRGSRPAVVLTADTRPLPIRCGQGARCRAQRSRHAQGMRQQVTTGAGSTTTFVIGRGQQMEVDVHVHATDNFSLMLSWRGLGAISTWLPRRFHACFMLAGHKGTMAV